MHVQNVSQAFIYIKTGGMTGEQVHKCSCHNWCGTMQHQRQARQGPGQQKLNESCCKLYIEDIGNNWHGGRDQATRA